MAFDLGSFYKSGRAPTVPSGPSKNPNTSTWNPGSGGVPRPGGYTSVANPDPFNWRGIAADLKAEEDRKNQAKTRVQQQSRVENPTAPRALQVAAPGRTPESDANDISAWQQMEAFMAMNNGALPPGVTPQQVEELKMKAGIAQSPMNPTPKQLLDAFRAMNNGALPPGMTPEQAAAIDAAPVPGVTGPLDPALAPIIAQFQALLAGLPGEYAAGKASVAGSYNNLTGDVLSSGKNWMQDLYGRVVDPNDPNAALAQQDPALAAYGQSMSEIDETSDLNQATDLAWFDKMQANAASTYQGLIATLMAQAPPVVEEEGGGGGGGGGGRGRGYGGGGGSGGGKGWTDPKTTITNSDTLNDQVGENITGYNPDLWPGLSAAATSPEEEAFFYDLYTKYGQQPLPLQKGANLERTTAEAKLKELSQQQLSRQNYLENVPARSEALLDMYRSNMGIQDNPEWEPGNPDKPRRFIPPENQGREQSYEQGLQNNAAQQIIGLQKEQAGQMLFGGLAPILKPGMSGKDKGKLKLADAMAALKVRLAQEQIDKEQYGREKMEWDKTNESDKPFPLGTYSGYISPVKSQDIADAEEYMDRVFRFSAALQELDPNLSPQRTQIYGKVNETETGKVSGTQSTYNPNAMPGGNAQEMYPNGVGASAGSSLPGLRDELAGRGPGSGGAGQFMGGTMYPGTQWDTDPLPEYNDKTESYFDPITGEELEADIGAGQAPTRMLPKGTTARTDALLSAARARLDAGKNKSSGFLGPELSNLFGIGKRPTAKKVKTKETPEEAPPLVKAGVRSDKTKVAAKTKAPVKKTVAPTPVATAKQPATRWNLFDTTLKKAAAKKPVAAKKVTSKTKAPKIKGKSPRVGSY